MKILVVSLLRLGDVLLSTSVLRNLKREYPDAQIHILINGQFASAADLIPYVSKVFGFERDALREMMDTPESSLLEAYFRIEDLAEQLQRENYDKVINLTHNRLSGWLTTLVGCADTQGVVYNSQGQFSVGSSWFDYLKNQVESGHENMFHFVDIFHYGAGILATDRCFEFRESDNGKAFVSKLLLGVENRRRLIIQPSSHESKNTFSVKKWREIADLIQSCHEDLDVYVLGTQADQGIIESICEGKSFVPVVARLDEIYSLLSKSHLLITCDTNLKHLASATKIKIVEVGLGGSEFRRTGVYTSGAVIIQSRGQSSVDKVSEEAVALVGGALLRQDEVALRMLAGELNEEVEIFKTHINNRGDWSAYPMNVAFSSTEICRWVDRTSSKLWLERAHEEQVGEFGSEGVELKHLLENIFPDRAGKAWLTELKQLEKNIDWLDARFETFLSDLKKLLPRFDNPSTMEEYLQGLKSFCREMGPSSLYRSYTQELEMALNDLDTEILPFHIVKKIRERLTDAHQRAKIEIKLIRGLQTEFTPNGET